MKIEVTGEWQTWDFIDRQHGPIVPAGTYEVGVTQKTETGWPAIVLAHPENHGGGPNDLWGADERSLRENPPDGVTLIEEEKVEPQPA